MRIQRIVLEHHGDVAVLRRQAVHHLVAGPGRRARRRRRSRSRRLLWDVRHPSGRRRLALEREFADKQLASALASLEQARNEVQRKQLYLERVAQPSKPDVAVLPKRLKAVGTTLAAGLLVWLVLRMLIAGVREHQD